MIRNGKTLDIHPKQLKERFSGFMTARGKRNQVSQKKHIFDDILAWVEDIVGVLKTNADQESLIARVQMLFVNALELSAFVNISEHKLKPGYVESVPQGKLAKSSSKVKQKVHINEHHLRVLWF